MELWEIAVSILLATISIVSTVIAIVKGLKKRKAMKEKTQAEQELDLKQFMVNECVSVENVSTRFKTVMTKEELSAYKRDTVLKNITLYAKACGYSWYNNGVWLQYLNDYIAECNSVAGKKHNITPNVG